MSIPNARRCELAAEFAKFGIQFVVELLSYDISDPQQKESLLFRLEGFWDPYRRLSETYCHLIGKVSPDIVDGGVMYYQLNRELNSSMELQKKVFEQRVWVFFDDARLYPTWNTASHFPSASFLASEPDKLDWFEGWEHNSDRIGALCRSQKWHDDYKKEMAADV
ncbi:Uncharacterized protein LW93_5116 [Fusarium fujikuroi]|nr:Uncharacterized protein LW93_5116 [Fusarium fujikuroi]